MNPQKGALRQVNNQIYRVYVSGPDRRWRRPPPPSFWIRPPT
jgi:hypothetical protein